MSYYAVRKGRVPGIYTKWREAERQIYLFSGAEFKKFDTREKAEAYMRGVKTPHGEADGKRADVGDDLTETERKEKLLRQFPDRDKHETIDLVVSKLDHNQWDVRCQCASQHYFFAHRLNQKDFETPALAGLYALCCLLNEWFDDSPYRPHLTIRIEKKRKQNNMYYVKNVIDKYLEQWAKNLWYTKYGPVKHIEIMKNLYERIKEFPYVHCIIRAPSQHGLENTGKKIHK